MTLMDAASYLGIDTRTLTRMFRFYSRRYGRLSEGTRWCYWMTFFVVITSVTALVVYAGTRAADSREYPVTSASVENVQAALSDGWSLKRNQSEMYDYKESSLPGGSFPPFWEPDEDSDLDTVGTFIRGEPTIFIKITSYRDALCPETVSRAYREASKPFRLFFGIVEQNREGDVSCSRPPIPCSQETNQPLCSDDLQGRLRVFRLPAEKAEGPVLARHIGDRLYRGEYFVFQIDSHSVLIPGWDDVIIDQWKATRNERAVLSAYPSNIPPAFAEAYKENKPVSVQLAHLTTNAVQGAAPIMCEASYEGLLVKCGGQPEVYFPNTLLSSPSSIPTHLTSQRGVSPPSNSRYSVPPFLLHGHGQARSPMLHVFWGAGQSFARGHFHVRVPYDCCLPMLFHGEEIDITVRGWTHGYDFYAPSRKVVFHWYTHPKPPSKFWENPSYRKPSEEPPEAKVASIINMFPKSEQEKYMTTRERMEAEWKRSGSKRFSLGTARNVDLFYTMFGIGRNEKTVSKNLCAFTSSGEMHNTFTPYLRENGKGSIDYSKIEESLTEKAAREGLALFDYVERRRQYAKEYQCGPGKVAYSWCSAKT